MINKLEKKSELAFEFASKLKPADDFFKKSKKLSNHLEKTEIVIRSDRVAKLLRRPKGSYLSINASPELFLDRHLQTAVTTELKKVLFTLFNRMRIGTIQNALVIGLGNRHFASDSLGAKVTDQILVTRHAWHDKKSLDPKLIEVSAFSTGVFGKTGVESAEIAKKICEIVKPQIVLIVDTLATSDAKRLGTSFQVSDSGIVPGGGLENNRVTINSKYLNLPIVVVGVPLVVYASDLCGTNKNLNKNLVVTPKDIEEYVKICSSILSSAINLALHRQLSMKILNEYK